MTTTGTTVKNAFLDAASPVSAASNTQKVTDKTQNFGDVLGKTAQKFADTSQRTNQTVANSTNAKSQQPNKTTFKNSKNAESVKDDRAVKNAADASTPVEEKKMETEEVTETEIGLIETMAEEPVDEIANVLEQIIEQIKKILGITDEELLSGMEELGIQPIDLLNVDNMAQLVANIAGEDSAISLVANEDLYTALQDITEVIDTQVNSLLENTGLTDEELDTVLQKLQESVNQDLSEQIPETEMAPIEEQYESAMTETLETVEEQVPDELVIIKEDNTSSDNKAAKQYDKLPENQQEDLTRIDTKSQVQNTEKDAKNSDGKESKHFGQGNAAQNFQNDLNEVSNTAAAEDTARYTSDTTDSIMRQLADMVKIVKNENLTEMELQLHPASLGTVNVSLTTKGGVVTAEFTTQNEAVKAAIEAQASQLRANLEEQGVKIEAIEVSVESHQMERNLEKDGSQQQKQSQEQETGRIQGMRRGRSSINLKAFADGEELEGEMQGVDDATRIAMEMMTANGNTMDLLA